MNVRDSLKLGADALVASLPTAICASEADIHIPDLNSLTGRAVPVGLVVYVIGMAYGRLQYIQRRNLQFRSSMADASQIIWETCKTYLLQQGKSRATLWVLIAISTAYYFGVLSHNSTIHHALIPGASVLGILGCYGVAWFGIRINTVANSRAAFSALTDNPLAGPRRERNVPRFDAPE